MEQQPLYTFDLADPDFHRWLAGDNALPAPGDWESMVTAKRHTGATMTRIRVFEEPPTPYQQWLHHISRLNLQAGEEVRTMSRATADRTGIADEAGDFWLIDYATPSATLVLFTYPDVLAPPQVEVTTDRAMLSAAATWWDRALLHSIADERTETTVG